MSQDRRDDKQRRNLTSDEGEGDTTMELSIRDVLNIQSHDHKLDRGLAEDSGVISKANPLPRTISMPAQRQPPAPYDDDDDDDTQSTSVVIPDARLLAAAAGKPTNDPTTEVRLDDALLASIRRTEEIQVHDNETSTFSIPKDLLRMASQGAANESRTIPMSTIRGPSTIELPDDAISPLTLHDEEDERVTRPAGRAPLEAIATIDPQGRLLVPIATLEAAGLRPGQRLKIVAYVIE
jgi:hypothetical protein